MKSLRSGFGLAALIILSFLPTFLPMQIVLSTHSVSASPPGGIYNSPQIVELSSEAASSIYYTTDGTAPSNSSEQYALPLEIVESTTLKFIAFDESDNHTSAIVTEEYVIDTVPPQVSNTIPSNGATRVDPRNSSFSVVFSEPMNESTINTDNIGIADAAGNMISGSVSYDAENFTATYIFDEEFFNGCVDCLNLGRMYTVTLAGDIIDEAGNHLQDSSFAFRTGGSMTITIIDVLNSEFLGGASIVVEPDPFDLIGSLTVEDDSDQDLDVILFEEQIPGTIVLFNAEFGTYGLNEVGPDGFIVLYENMIITIHDTNRRASGTFRNIPNTSTLDDVEPVLVPPPNLNVEQFELYAGNATRGIFSGVKGTELGNRSPISTVGPNAIPDARLASPARVEEITFAIESVVFNLTAPDTFTSTQLFDEFLIPTYANPTEVVAGDSIYVVPAFVIPYENENNNFILTPILGKIFPGMTLALRQESFVETEVAKVSSLNMTFNVEGNDIGFSFGITDNPPPGTPNPPLTAPALFLDVGFVGDVDFSDADSFESSPKIDVLVNKTLPGFPELPNGCPDFKLLFFNGNDWEEVQKLDPTGNFTDFCPFTLEPEHFSKFAVGGVKGQPIQTEQERESSGGGGRSRSTAITQTPTGTNVETAVTTESGIVLIRFESVDAGSGQIKINANELSVFEEFFDELAFLSQDNGEHGMVRIAGNLYATAGDVFDIDASAVMFEGRVDVTIPYDEETVSRFGSESDVKFIHYNEGSGAWDEATASVDESANTVTGTLESLSPVAAAIILSGGNIDVDTTRMQVQSPEFTISSGTVSMSANLKNLYLGSQEYVLIVQIVDDRGVAQHIDWQAGTLAQDQETDVGMNWQDLADGTYGVRVIVLTDLDEPWFLSEPVSGQFDIRTPS